MAILTHRAFCRPDVTRRFRRRRGPWALICVLATLTMSLTVDVSPAGADETPPSEYQVKAAFLVNFPKYVEWPATAFSETNSPIVIAVLGESKVIGEIQKIIAGRTANGRGIVLQRVASGANPTVCHILFISAAEQEHSTEVLARLKDTPVLTVGESNDFLERGGIINLARRDKKIALEVNLTATDQARIQISSKLLSVAGVVKGRGK